MIDNNDPALRNLINAAEVGMWGLSLRFLTENEGGSAALAQLANVRAGKADLVCSVRFHGLDATLEGWYEAHGARTKVFTLQLTQSPDPQAPAKGQH